MADDDYRRLAAACPCTRKCERCGATFDPPTKRSRYCTKRCAQQARDAIRRRKPNVQCPECGATFERTTAQKVFCGSTCKHRAWDRRNPDKVAAQALRAAERIRAHQQQERSTRAPFSKVYARRCDACGKPDVRRESWLRCEPCDARLAADKARLRAEAAHKKAARSVTCLGCEAVFCPTYGAQGPAERCAPCSDANTRQHRRTDRKKRKLKKRSVAVESVRDIEVLERDDWKCYLCGRDTPRHLRGTHAPNAPEVEHVVPVARGGPHSYANVRCACRECNQTKRDEVWDEDRMILHRLTTIATRALRTPMPPTYRWVIAPGAEAALDAFLAAQAGGTSHLQRL